MTLLDEVTQLTCDLVAIESVNPDLVKHGAGEKAIAEFVAGWLRKEGLTVETIERVPGRPSVVGILHGKGGGRSLMLNAHVDTVGAGGMVDAFKPFVDEGRIHGRGAYDMKGSLAAIMLAAKHARSLDLAGDLIITAVADEEVASTGTSAVLERFTADAAIVTEPTELRLCTAHKGFVWLEVEVRGVAAHGSRADLGVDAIAHMGPVLTGLTQLGERLRGGRRHRLLGTGSVHASLVDGGQEMSTYPARCVCRIERRTIPGEDGATALRELEDIVERARSGMPALDALVRVTLARDPSDVAMDSPIAAAVAESASEVLGARPEVVGVAYWMDMALTNAAGIPTVAFGPAGHGEHADVEWVDAASLESCVRTYLATAARVCARA